MFVEILAFVAIGLVFVLFDLVFKEQLQKRLNMNLEAHSCLQADRSEVIKKRDYLLNEEHLDFGVLYLIKFDGLGPIESINSFHFSNLYLLIAYQISLPSFCAC
jgi:hypothetical protein